MYKYILVIIVSASRTVFPTRSGTIWTSVAIHKDVPGEGDDLGLDVGAGGGLVVDLVAHAGVHAGADVAQAGVPQYD